ncbi:MAG: 1-acyl-sn-glycerol-3-phosphate acyltransferase [Acidobacteriota bacterium]|nr:MAG: 1-acyl-sn-glycerol-3-phosphate acyltransferase [Acidobacteriota bacterium]
MWLLPILSILCSLVARIFYRFRVSGPSVPREGPLLLVANHPNALLDPALVTAAARRPVRFLAKSPLLSDWRFGWLMKAGGAIPVYRRIDDPASTDQNVETFRAVLDALADGAAIGIFPEGITHSEPSLARLKTGAARMALDFAVAHGHVFPIVPVGLVLRDKDVYRSEALAVIGDPIVWDDLAGRTAEEQTAVHELTQRIDTGLREVTVNLERWEDRPLVEWAEQIWATEKRAPRDPADQVARLEQATKVLAALRCRSAEEWKPFARRLRSYGRRLGRLGLRPSNLAVRTDLSASLSWTVRRLHWLGPPAVVLAGAALVIFRIPYELTGLIVRAFKPAEEVASTAKVLVGALLYGLWVVLLAILVGAFAHWMAGVAALILLPVVGVAGMRIRERWRGAWGDVRRFFLMRSRRELIEQLRREQSELAEQLVALYRTWRKISQ